MTKPRYIVGVYKLTSLFVMLFSLLCGGIGAAQAITRGYSSDDVSLKPGMAVKLSSSSTPDNPKVERATNDSPNSIIGIATTVDNSSVTISSGDKPVFIETTGEVDAYVADLNGDVKKGDLLTISPLRGILAKVDPTSQAIIGIALEDFSTKATEEYTITTDKGEQMVHLATIKISLDRKAGPQQTQSDTSLKRLGRSISGKDICEIRVIVALIIFFVVLVAEGGILYGAITSAITAFGRNPMAKNVIRKELVRVMVIAAFVLLVGLGAVYGILWV